MSDGPLRGKDFVVISPLKGLIPEEMDLIKVTLRQELQRVGLIPSHREDIKRDLSPDAVRQSQIGKFLPHGSHHILTDVMLEVKLLKIIPLHAGAIAADGGDVEHSTAEFNESSTLDGNVDVRQILHDPIDEFLDILLAEEFGDGLDLEHLTILVGDESILAKVVRKGLDNAIAQLLFLLGQIGSTDDANGNFFREGFHEGHHIGCDLATGDGEGPIDIKESDYTWVGRCRSGRHLLFFCVWFRRRSHNGSALLRSV
mmetsp:Transcript_4710/g.6910  ORF Transcript_4710/g.6910 Transcript_4710/m.6910 type:complete len:257 (-) Transcript_4710:57-827(-)